MGASADGAVAVAGSAPPYSRMLVMGDSIAWNERLAAGLCVGEPSPPQLHDFGSPHLELVNRSLPASVISPRNPSYAVSAKPSLIERYGSDCAQFDPDLVVIAEAVNDVRAGMPIAHYGG